MSTDVVLLERVWPPAIPPSNHVSQIGGWPNLPDDMVWPEIELEDGARAALDFLAQIDLTALPQVSQRGHLPASGTLYFFALSQSHVGLDELGPGAARVLYSPVDAQRIPRRRPPPHAGWNQDEMEHGRTVAAEFRDTDAPRTELHPRCPIMLRSAQVADEGTATTPVRSFDFGKVALPRRVEDATLHINFARNFWRENILPFEFMRDHFTMEAEAHVEFEGKPLPSGWVPPRRPRPTHVDNCLSKEFWAGFRTDYMRWRDDAAALKARLFAMGGNTILADEQRQAVRDIVETSDRLAKQVDDYGLLFNDHPPQAAKIALATVLLEHPDIAREHHDEVMAAHPRQQRPTRTMPHRMLGSPFNVQGGTMRGPEPVLLLQLDSDEWGPRFSWFDGGNLTFWISAADAAAGRFERACAEIEGH